MNEVLFSRPSFRQATKESTPFTIVGSPSVDFLPGHLVYEDAVWCSLVNECVEHQFHSDSVGWPHTTWLLRDDKHDLVVTFFMTTRALEISSWRSHQQLPPASWHPRVLVCRQSRCQLEDHDTIAQPSSGQSQNIYQIWIRQFQQDRWEAWIFQHLGYRQRWWCGFLYSLSWCEYGLCRAVTTKTWEHSEAAKCKLQTRLRTRPYPLDAMKELIIDYKMLVFILCIFLILKTRSCSKNTRPYPGTNLKLLHLELVSIIMLVYVFLIRVFQEYSVSDHRFVCQDNKHIDILPSRK